MAIYCVADAVCRQQRKYPPRCHAQCSTNYIPTYEVRQTELIMIT